MWFQSKPYSASVSVIGPDKHYFESKGMNVTWRKIDPLTGPSYFNQKYTSNKLCLCLLSPHRSCLLIVPISGLSQGLPPSIFLNRRVLGKTYCPAISFYDFVVLFMCLVNSHGRNILSVCAQQSGHS